MYFPNPGFSRYIVAKFPALLINMPILEWDGTHILEEVFVHHLKILWYLQGEYIPIVSALAIMFEEENLNFVQYIVTFTAIIDVSPESILLGGYIQAVKLEFPALEKMLNVGFLRAKLQ